MYDKDESIVGTELKKGDLAIKFVMPQDEDYAEEKANRHLSLIHIFFGGGISALGWKEGEMDLVWDRSVSKADGNQLTLDAPLTLALDNKWGTVKVLSYSWPGRIAEAGLENLTLASDYNKKYPKISALR